ncbi:MAG: LysM peptidoglycan-binding domain-containing protein [bacterium]|nr:LysM peptidoglycan-binding domain-containing protein [bacterium]
MKEKLPYIFRYFLVLFIIVLTASLTVGEETGTLTIKDAPGSKVYIIQKGDTLWDISGREYSDNFKWPVIWKQNSYIANPDLIYPGNELVIPGVDEKTVVTIDTHEEGTFFETKYPVYYGDNDYEYTEYTYEEPREYFHYNCPADVVLAAGYVKYEHEFVESGYVLGDVEYREKKLDSRDEEVVLSFTRNTPGVSLGNSFLSYRWGRKVNDLDGTKNYLGRVVEIVGVLVITEIGDESSKGMIVKSFTPTLKGDLLRPYHSVSGVDNFNNSGPSEKIGYIVASRYDEILPTQLQSIVYIDSGRRHGVSVGNVFDVYKIMEEIKEPKSKKEKRYVYKEHLGKVYVINVEQETATCAVLEANETFEIGNYIRFTTEE